MKNKKKLWIQPKEDFKPIGNTNIGATSKEEKEDKMIYKTWGEARNNQTKPVETPFGRIYKDLSEVCFDIHCKCGIVSHYDGKYLNVIQCYHCETQYYVGAYIELLEIEEYKGIIAIAGKEDLK